MSVMIQGKLAAHSFPIKSHYYPTVAEEEDKVTSGAIVVIRQGLVIRSHSWFP